MFTPHLNKAIGFESSWKTEQQLTFGSTQTEDVISKDSECQVLETTESSAQTDEEVPKSMGSAEVNESSLLEFLRRITPQILDVLEMQDRSAAFEGYTLVDDAANTGAVLQHMLRWPQLFPQGVVTELTWSSTGAVVAVAYGADTHDTWCQHRAAVALWNVNRCDAASISPERVLEVSSCVPAVAFHPSNPALLAVGTRTGEVLVYDLSDSESVTPLATADTGGSGVTCVVWRGGGGMLAAATEGGHVLIWTVSVTKQTITLDTGFLVVSGDLPRPQRSMGGGDDGEGVGLTGLSFNSEDPTVFVVAAEGGAVLLCSTAVQVPAPVAAKSPPLRRCVVSSLAPHGGRVVAARCCPHHRNALATLASDQQLRLYSLLQPGEPVSTLHSDVALTAMRWAPHRPTLLAAAAHSGQVNFLDVCGLQRPMGGVGGNSGPGAPLLTLPPPEKPAAVSALAFNSANPGLLAVGDRMGRVWVWRLPTGLVAPHTGDLARLNKLLTREADE